MVAYLDSSLVLRALLQGDSGIDQVWTLSDIFSSELLAVECRRAIFREHLQQKLDDEKMLDLFHRLHAILARLQILELDAAIKRRAGEAFPVHVKTLDAMHLATALAVAQEYPDQVVAVFSYDAGMNRAAKVLGLAAPFYS